METDYILKKKELLDIYDRYAPDLADWDHLDELYIKLDKDAFWYKSGLTSLFVIRFNIPLDKLLSYFSTLHDLMFDNVSYIPDEFTIPNNIEIIREVPFLNIDNLKKLIIPDTVKEVVISSRKSYHNTTIASNCKNLTTISLPASMTEINGQVCRDCPNLKTIIISPNCQQVSIIPPNDKRIDVIYYIQSPNTQVEVKGRWKSEDEKNEWVNQHLAITY